MDKRKRIKARSTKHAHTTKDRVTRTPLKIYISITAVEFLRLHMAIKLYSPLFRKQINSGNSVTFCVAIFMYIERGFTVREQ